MSDLGDAVDGIIHDPTQRRDDGGVDLTVKAVYTVQSPGRIDFGGDELQAADLTPHPQVRRDPDDEYQWWELSAGTYLIEYNESLTSEALLQPRSALVERGGTHPTLRVAALPRVPLTVGGAGIRIKANARVSTLLPV